MLSIASQGYSAIVNVRGAELISLQFRGRHVVVPGDVNQPNSAYRGSVLAPWPNRLADGRYRYDGVDYQVDINEPSRQTALHGLVYEVPWTVVSHSADSCELTCVIDDSVSYPSKLELSINYSLAINGLTIELTAHNQGSRTAPYGCSIHPYLVAGTDALDEWTLSLGCDQVQHVDGERLLPTRVGHVSGTLFDFCAARPIGSTEIDNAFRNDGINRMLHLRSTMGTGVEMEWSDDCVWVQLHTADRPGLGHHRAGLAVEPMTCPPDALNSGVDLVHLVPDASHKTVWRIAAY